MALVHVESAIETAGLSSSPKLVSGHRRTVPTRELLRLESRYLVEHRFCRVRRPNEGGHLDDLIGYARRNFPAPVPETDRLLSLA